MGKNKKDIRLKVNKPFVFLIRDNESNVTLFAGRITDPEISSEKKSETLEAVNIDRNFVAANHESGTQDRLNTGHKHKAGKPMPVIRESGLPNGFLANKKVHLEESIPNSHSHSAHLNENFQLHRKTTRPPPLTYGEEVRNIRESVQLSAPSKSKANSGYQDMQARISTITFPEQSP